MNSNKVPATELQARLARFREIMDNRNAGWEIAFIASKLNQYYFTGTMQEGLLIIPREGEAIHWVRRSFERAVDESEFSRISPMESYRDIVAHYKNFPETLYLETEFVPLAMLQRLQKYFPFKNTKPIDNQISQLRSVKSNYEIKLMELSGKIHQKVLEERMPALLKEGMSEVELAAILNTTLLEEGHQGLVRFAMFDTEVLLGHIAFGVNSIYPSSFNGPGGNSGISPASPHLGDPNRKLRKGDLVFLDVGCGINGYHTDKTCTYMFGKSLPQYAIDEHKKCVDVQNHVAALLKPGAIPSQIYEDIISSLSPEFITNFMGFGKRQVKFLGHGIGLTVDELPVIAKGFDEPLSENMVFAIEPKKGIEGIGMVGIENTFVVSMSGGRCITGDNPGLILVD